MSKRVSPKDTICSPFRPFIACSGPRLGKQIVKSKQAQSEGHACARDDGISPAQEASRESVEKRHTSFKLCVSAFSVLPWHAEL